MRAQSISNNTNNPSTCATFSWCVSALVFFLSVAIEPRKNVILICGHEKHGNYGCVCNLVVISGLGVAPHLCVLSCALHLWGQGPMVLAQSSFIHFDIFGHAELPSASLHTQSRCVGSFMGRSTNLNSHRCTIEK